MAGSALFVFVGFNGGSEKASEMTCCRPFLLCFGLAPFFPSSPALLCFIMPYYALFMPVFSSSPSGCFCPCNSSYIHVVLSVQQQQQLYIHVVFSVQQQSSPSCCFVRTTGVCSSPARMCSSDNCSIFFVLSDPFAPHSSGHLPFVLLCLNIFYFIYFCCLYLHFAFFFLFL